MLPPSLGLLVLVLLLLEVVCEVEHGLLLQGRGRHHHHAPDHVQGCDDTTLKPEGLAKSWA